MKETKMSEKRSHRDRKNPNSREAYQKRKRELNALRGKQKYNEETKTWER